MNRRTVAAVLLFAASAIPAAAESPAPPVAASSVHPPGATSYDPVLAFDGDPKTRWASHGAGDQWIQIDLGKTVRIPAVAIRWEAASASEYEVQVSDDGRAWKTVAREARGAGGRAQHDTAGASGRWLRVACRKPGPHPLYSIWDVELPAPENAGLLAAALARARQEEEQAARERRAALASALARHRLREVVFAARELGPDGHWYANIAYFAPDPALKCYRKRGRLSKLDLATGQVAHLVDDPEGTVRDPVVHYDGQKILFSYRPGAGETFHLYEIGLDGRGLTRLTDGPYDDIEPAYLPDGGIVFVSGRARRWVNCWLTQVAILHRCDADGRNIRPLSANIEHDNTPWVLPDGRILYTRWEYVDRSQVDYHHLWTANPDGTGHQVFYGNYRPGGVFIDAKPIPGTDRVLFINSPGHGQREHAGHVATVTAAAGPDLPASLRNITPGAGYRDPYPLDADTFLVARGRELLLLNGRGDEQAVYALTPDFGGAELHEPRPVLPRPREPVAPVRANLARATGTLVLADAHHGRNMGGVKPGEIRSLLVLESLPKPVNFTGGMDPLSYGGTFTLARILGTVPVEPDGSACFELPADRAFLFVALDKDNLSVKRMQSFCSVAPGETLSCVGCHEHRAQAAMPARGLMALRRPPSRVAPVAGVPEVIDFPRDVQPVLDRHCVRCHDADRPAGATRPEEGPRAGGVLLAGDRGPMFSHSYFDLTIRREFSDGRDDARSNFPPRALGSAASPLLKKLDGGHYGARPEPREIDLLRLWIDVGAPYPGTYAALGSGMIGGYAANNLELANAGWPEAKAAGEAVQRRCAACHTGPRVLPLHLSDERGISFWKMDIRDPRLPWSRHRVFNLTRPEKSLMLLAPLAPAAGGHGTCRAKGPDGKESAVFADAKDPDYLKILALCAAGKRRLDGIKRFDMPGFRPPEPYLREMKRYGILPAVPPPGQPVDPYPLDRAYWESFWYRPQAAR
jgi:hypothetical protein